MMRWRHLAGSILVISAAAPLPALAQHLGGGTDPEISLVRIVASLVLCIGVAIALALVISKRGLPAKGWGLQGLSAKLRSRNRIVVIEARRISPHADVCLVQCDGTEYLMVCGQGDIRVLRETAVDSGVLPAQDEGT
jgi:hypothetical protein